MHDQVVAIDPANRTVTLSLINGYSFGKPVFYISTESSDPTVSAIEGNTFAPRLRRIETGVDDINRSAVERIFMITAQSGTPTSMSGPRKPSKRAIAVS